VTPPRATHRASSTFRCHVLARELTRGRCLGNQVRVVNDASEAGPCGACLTGRAVALSLGVVVPGRGQDAGKGGDDAA
jgi:hypothetical protein